MKTPIYLLSAYGQRLGYGQRLVAKFVASVMRNSGLQVLLVTLGLGPVPVLIPVYVTMPYPARRRR